MTRLLLIADDPQAQNLSSALSSAADFQVHRRSRLADARAALEAGAFDAVLLAPGSQAATDDVTALRALGRTVAVAVLLPSGAASEAQNAPLAAGADLVLSQPVDAVGLARALERLAARTVPAGPAPQADAGTVDSRSAGLSSALEVLRSFSQVLGYSLDHRQLTQHFVLRLRDLIGVSRIAIFLEKGDTDLLPGSRSDSPADTKLECAAAYGIASEITEFFALSKRSGLGGKLVREPQILRAPGGTTAPTLDPRIVRELEVVGGAVAIPVCDRERTIGVAILGGRITGGGFSDQELLLVHHLLEELGLAVKNSWLHRQLVASHRLFASVLDGITVAAVVIGPDLRVLYSNPASAPFLGGAPGPLDFNVIPAPVARRVRELVEKGARAEPFFHETPAGRTLRASLVPLGSGAAPLPQTVLLLLEDFTQVRAAQRAEIDASNFKLISLIARRFAHEIRNALVPLTTHQQLFESEIESPEFRESLRATLARETQRIQRFTDQMLLLARAESPPAETVSLDDVLRTAFAKSREFSGVPGELELRGEPSSILLRCHRPSLVAAFQEIFLNGLQSSGALPQVDVSVAPEAGPGGRPEIAIRIRDSGAGFAAESAPRATEPFFTTRNTGVGLGLTIARRVIEAHNGRLDILARSNPDDPDLVIHLPLPT